MYSNIKSVQFLLAALKSYNIDKVVVSPGNSHNAIVRSLEEDDFFKTYSIVDERSAAFFACGISQELNQPVAICCTAGTAASNYLSGVTEAFRRNVPIVVITADKHPYFLNQNEDQMIDQMSMFETITKSNKSLPIIENDMDSWYCQRLLNEALLELNHNGSGPIHINVPIAKGMLAIDTDFNVLELPKFNRIHRFNLKDSKENWSKIFSTLNNKKVLIICGQNSHIKNEEFKLIEQISEKYNCVFAVDKISNLRCGGTLEISRAVRTMSGKGKILTPDIVISIAGNTALDYKFHLKNANVEHWLVNESGRIADSFKSLKLVFEGNVIEFLKIMSEFGDASNGNEYFSNWKECYDSFKMPEFEYSNIYALHSMLTKLPKNSNLNIGNSTNIRLAQYFEIDPSVQIYCNRGVNGIDGCVSTFIGQAAASPEKMNYLVVGDLTFFYDMNALWNRYLNPNIRIMLNNNEGAALFHFNQGLEKYPTLNENVAAEHFATAKGWVETQGFKYMSATNKEEFDKNLVEFLATDTDKPIFFEVFTKKEQDAKYQKEFYEKVAIHDARSAAIQFAKKSIKKVLGKN